MDNIEIKSDCDIIKLNNLKDSEKDFSITKYINEYIYLFAGKIIEATLELNSSDCIQFIKDWFGENVDLIETNDKIFAQVKCNETALFYWVMQYADCVKVIKPKSFVARVKNGLRDALAKYE